MKNIFGLQRPLQSKVNEGQDGAASSNVETKQKPTAGQSKIDEKQQNIAKLASLYSHLKTYKVSGKYSDFTIKVCNKEYKVHKIILAPQSSVFDDIFTADSSEQVITLTNVKNFSEKSFESFLNFFYTGQVDPEADVVETFELASEFNVAGLKTTSVQRIIHDLNKDNALKTFNYGKQHSNNEITRAAFRALKQTYPDLVDSLIDDAESLNELVTAKLKIAAILEAETLKK